MKSILLGAKYFAMHDQSQTITLKHFKQSLECFDISKDEFKTIIYEKMDAVIFGTKTELNVEKLSEAQSAPKISYDDALKSVLKELEENGLDISVSFALLHVMAKGSSDYFTQIKQIKEALSQKALGQGLAVESISDGLMKAIYSSHSNRPYASFLFAGPQSPAKAHLARELSTLLFDYVSIHLPMSSYNTGNGSMQLFGIPEPYDGHKVGILTSFVKENPKAFIIVDEVEFAEKEAQVFFSKIINEGKCADSHSSEVIDFSQCIIIFTTSAGKEVYTKHTFMQMAQNNQSLAEKMILDALSRETGSHKKKESSQHSEGTLFEPSLMMALRQTTIAFFGKLGFTVCVQLVKEALIQGISDFEAKLNIKINVENSDQLVQLLLLSSGPEFDLESIKSKSAPIILDILTDQVIASEKAPKKMKVTLDKEAKSYLSELIASEKDDKLIHTLFRKSQTVTYSFTYEKDCLTFHTLALEKVKRAQDFGEEGGFTIELPDVTFQDIAGHHKVKERLKETMSILKSKTLSMQLGKHMPKGMLLYGPPGTGKTMLAKAFAKEADLPFIATTGPDLLADGMMQKVFDKARDYAPAIVFIDEIDVFKQRGKGYGTDFLINKLLTLIDGFSTKEEERIFIVAATNLKESIDDAILRSGRLDLHVLVDRLDKDARAWFIDKMLKQEEFNKKIDRERILRYTADFSGADLQKIESESILYANRKGLKSIDEAIVVEQINILKYGEKIEDNAIDIMLERTAYHEAGHAVISKMLMPAQKIEQITVTPRGNALGFVSYDTQAYQNHSKVWFQNSICVALAGRAAEMKQYASEGIESGASSDLIKANRLAYIAIAELGMDEKLFNISLKGYGEHKLYTQHIEQCIQQWIQDATRRTEDLVQKHWKSIERLAKQLLKDEVVEEKELESLLEK